MILFDGCRIARLNVYFNSNMSDYSSMATLQNNSQTAGFAAALQRAKLVSGTRICIIAWLHTLGFLYRFCVLTFVMNIIFVNHPLFNLPQFYLGKFFCYVYNLLIYSTFFVELSPIFYCLCVVIDGYLKSVGCCEAWGWW